MLKNTTVVMGGGGVWGVAWMTGLLRGLAEHGLDLSQAHTFIGTSAGSVVSAQLACGIDLELLYRQQTDPNLQSREVPAKTDGLEKLLEILAQPAPADHLVRAREIGRLALQAQTIDYAQRRADIVGRLGLSSDAWPAKRLVITAVDCESAELAAFDAQSGVSLCDAVAASCAVPCVWPATPINGRFYTDGGVWKTPENAHLARGAERVIVLAPFGATPPSAAVLEADIAALRAGGSKVALLTPDAASSAAQSLGILDPASRKPAATAGRAQAPAALEQLRSILQ